MPFSVRDVVQDVTKSVFKEINVLDLSPKLWLDASDPSTITADGSGKITEWKDKSSNNRHFPQSDASIRPEYVNGVVEFNVDGARLENRFTMSARSLFIVYKDTNPSFSTPFTSNILDGWFHGSADVTTIFNASFTSANMMFADHYVNGIKFNYNEAPGSLDDKPSEFKVFNINTTELYSETEATWYVGNDRAFSNRNVDAIKEIIVFDRVISDTDRQAIEQYLMFKYGVIT